MGPHRALEHVVLNCNRFSVSMLFSNISHTSYDLTLDLSLLKIYVFSIKKFLPVLVVLVRQTLVVKCCE